MIKTNQPVENQDYLKELGFNINSKGFLIWNTAIMIYSKAYIMNTNYTMTDLYKELAELYFTTTRSIESLMSTALKPAKENIQKKYEYNGKITNKTFLNLYCMRG